MNYYLGIDIGSFESKGMLIDETGHTIATARRAHVMETPEEGYAEHDADRAWWGDFCEISKEILAGSGVDPKQVKGVGCSAIAPCCLPVDEHDRPLRKAILYGVDVRAAEQIERLNNEMDESSIMKKCGSPVTSQSAGPKILWIRENEPEIYRRTKKFVTASTFLVARLTGRYVIDHYTAAYFTPMYDLASRNWDTEHIERFCRLEQLPECMWTNEIAGYVTKAASEDTGLAVGTPVTVGTADASADAVGAGAFHMGDLLLMFGSSLYMIHAVPRLTTDSRYWAGPFLFENTFMVASGMSTTGTLTRWFRDELAPDFVRAQEQGEGDAYELLVRSAEGIRPGSDGLIVLPYFSGERTPIHDPAARGVFFGLTLQHTRAHLYHACLEGVGYGIAQHLSGYQEIGMETKRIIAVGGGTRARKWMQIVADITGRSLIVGDDYGASFGDALLAAMAVGELSIQEIIEDRSDRNGVIPNLENTERYKPFVNMYTELYEATKNMMHQL